MNELRNRAAAHSDNWFEFAGSLTQRLHAEADVTSGIVARLRDEMPTCPEVPIRDPSVGRRSTRARTAHQQSTRGRPPRCTRGPT